MKKTITKTQLDSLMRNSLSIMLLAALAIAAGSAQGASKASFTLSIHAQQDAVKAGSPVMVDVVRTNVSNRVINDSRTFNPGEYYTFYVTRGGGPAGETRELRDIKESRAAVQDPTSPRRSVTSWRLGSLKPGKTSRDVVPVSSFYDMSQPGQYTIQLEQPDYPEGKLAVKSNAIAVKSNTITVAVTE
jgi:hypothetical protein